jgi:hypothetical protein
MELRQVLAINLETAHDAFLKTMADVTPEMARWLPPGIMHPIGERYAHVVMAEDYLVNGIARGGEPLFLSEWAGRTGFNADPMLLMTLTSEIARQVRVDDLNGLGEYTRAVFANTQDFINRADDALLNSSVDMSIVGYGQVPFPIWFSAFVVGHLHDVMGEISALKGCLGVKGYPF